MHAANHSQRLNHVASYIDHRKAEEEEAWPTAHCSSQRDLIQNSQRIGLGKKNEKSSACKKNVEAGLVSPAPSLKPRCRPRSLRSKNEKATTTATSAPVRRGRIGTSTGIGIATWRRRTVLACARQIPFRWPSPSIDLSIRRDDGRAVAADMVCVRVHAFVGEWRGRVFSLQSTATRFSSLTTLH